jgi:protein TonB
MFEDSLVESTSLLRHDNRWPALVSVTAQLLAAAAVLSLPLLHPETLPLARSLSATLAPPRPPAPPPPIVHLRPQPALAPRTSASAAVPQTLTSVLRDLLHPSGPPVDAPALPIIDLGVNSPTLPAGINTAAPAGPRIHVGPPAAASASALTRISTGVSAGLLLAPIRPEYPAIARLTRTEGTVTIEATISRSGAIESAHALSGPPILQQAALDAVRHARYRPYLLNGQPTAVQTTITIHFHATS